MKFTIDLQALVKTKKKIARLADISPHLGPLMTSFMKIITEDNRKGVLAGTDKNGHPMDPVTYRPIGRARRLTADQKNVANNRLRRGGFDGLGIYAAGLHNILTRREHERLAGPPLAPRGAFSRVITNLITGYQRLDSC